MGLRRVSDSLWDYVGREMGNVLTGIYLLVLTLHTGAGCPPCTCSFKLSLIQLPVCGNILFLYLFCTKNVLASSSVATTLLELPRSCTQELW
jgi:hypothetical protein